MDKESNHFVVKAQGKLPVHVYFAQEKPLTACVAKITIKKREEVKHYVVAHGVSFWNPKDEWNEMLGKQKAFGKMKRRVVKVKACGRIPLEKDFERAFYEWMKEQNNG